MRRNNSLVWNYFDKEKDRKWAVCRFCHKPYSFQSTTANLKGHLRHSHNEIYSRIDWERKNENKEDDEAEELLKVNDLWSFFETDSRKARCVLCKDITGTDYDEIKAHMKENHPKIMLQVMQDKEHSDAASNDDEDADPTYTEVVYLDQEETSPDTIIKKEKPKLQPILKKRRRTSVFDNPLPPKRSNDSNKHKIIDKSESDSDELTSFVKYITCLLRKLPPDVFSSVQIELIHTILRANSQNNSVLLNKELASTSAHTLNFEVKNYTITDEPQDNITLDTDGTNVNNT